MVTHLQFIGYLFLFILTVTVQGEVLGDFDGDGKTDLTVMGRNNQDGRLHWYTLKSTNNNFIQSQWGYQPGTNTSDIPALGDYDGDGKTDIAVFRITLAPYNTIPNYFFILRSSDSILRAEQLGLNGDTQIPQDYDGDGKTDPAVTTGTPQGTMFLIIGSRDGFFTRLVPGVSTPVHGDYDGDGKADAAGVGSDNQYRQYFYILKSSTNQIQVTQFGNGLDDMSVPGDYDGDGKTNIAVWRGKSEGSTGRRWYWIRSSDGNWGVVKFGTSYIVGDYPVPGDYDGDGKTDPAIWRRELDPNTGTDPQSYFFILGSSRGFYAVPWGLATRDVPPVFWSR